MAIMKLNSTDFNRYLYTFKAGLQNFAVSFTKNVEDANDLVQDTFVKAIRYSRKYKEGTNFRGWLFTIIKNTFISTYRKELREKALQTVLATLIVAQTSNKFSFNEGINKCVRKDIQKALDNLDNNHYIPFVKYFEGYKYHEIAKDLKLPIGTVKTRIHAARMVLRNNLKMYRWRLFGNRE